MALSDEKYTEILTEIWFQRNKIIQRTSRDPKRIFLSYQMVAELGNYHREHFQITPGDPNLVTMFGIKVCKSPDLEFDEIYVV